MIVQNVDIQEVFVRCDIGMWFLCSGYQEPKFSKESSPEELHPQALAEPDMNLSAHPAPIIHRPRKDSHLPMYK
jgi:hypothetical protein